MRHLRRLMCLSLLSLPFAAAAYGAVTMTASLGFAGKTPATGWCPILVDLRNDGEATMARLSVPADPHGTAPNSYFDTPLSCTRDVPLPAYGHLRCFLYVPSLSRATSVSAKVGSTAQSVSLTTRTYGNLTRTVVVIGGGPDHLLQELDGLPVQSPTEDASASRNDLLSIAHVAWSDLPDQWVGWSGVATVVLADRQWAQASPEARQALLQWVRLGGTLIVPGGAPSAAYAPDLRAVLPLVANSLNPHGDIAAVGRWLGHTAAPPPAMLAIGPLRRGSGTLCAVGGQPLVVTASLGSGEVTMTAFDYTAPEVAQWTLQADLWRRLIHTSLSDAVTIGPRGSPLAWRTGGPDMGGLARSMPQARRLPWRGMVLYLLVYVALLGPAQFLWLRRRGRQWSWLTTLGIIAFFTLNAFVIGTALRGRRVVIYRASAIEAQSGEPVGTGVGAVGMFSPGNGSYRFTTQPVAIGLGALDSLRQGGSLRQDSPWQLDTGPFAMWTLRVARLDFAADLGQGIQARAVCNGQTLQVRVANGTGLTFRQVQVLADGRRAEGDQPLPPGQILELTYDHDVGPERPVASRGRSNVTYGFPPAGTLKPSELVQEMSRLGREAIERENDLSAAEPVLLAVTTDPVVPLIPTARRAQVEDVTLVQVPLQATVQQGTTVAVPAWLVGKRSLLAEDPGTSVTTTPRRHLLEYRVPVGPLGGTPLSLSFVMPEQPGTAHGYPGPDDPVKFEATQVAAFNFQTGKWQTLPRDLDRWRVPTPDQFLTREGRLQLSYHLPDRLPPQMRHGSQELNTTLELKAVVRAW